MPYLDNVRQREYQRTWVAARRAAFFKDKACVVCGSDMDLELDHIDPSTKVSHSIWSWGETKRAEELVKCQVLCFGCHRKKTDLIYVPMRQHGRRGMYLNGCRCAVCRKGNANARAAWRKRTGRH